MSVRKVKFRGCFLAEFVSDKFKFSFIVTSSWDSLVGIACWLEHQTRDRKVASSNPSKSGRRTFSSRVKFVCWLLFGVRSTPVLPQWHIKDPGHSAKSAGGRLHLNMHTPVTHRSRSGLTKPLSRQSARIYQEMSSHVTPSGSTQSQSSQLAKPLLTDLGLQRWISLHELISTQKKTTKKPAQAGNELSNTLPKSSHTKKKPPNMDTQNCFHTLTYI